MKFQKQLYNPANLHAERTVIGEKDIANQAELEQWQAEAVAIPAGYAVTHVPSDHAWFIVQQTAKPSTLEIETVTQAPPNTLEANEDCTNSIPMLFESGPMDYQTVFQQECEVNRRLAEEQAELVRKQQEALVRLMQ